MLDRCMKGAGEVLTSCWIGVGEVLQRCWGLQATCIHPNPATWTFPHVALRPLAWNEPHCSTKGPNTPSTAELPSPVNASKPSNVTVSYICIFKGYCLCTPWGLNPFSLSEV